MYPFLISFFATEVFPVPGVPVIAIIINLY
jgi:hypothetical protein